MAILLIASVLCVLAGLAHYAAEFPVYWKPDVFRDFLAWSAACLGIAWLLRRVAKVRATRLFALAILLYLSIGVGFSASAAVALLFLSAFLYGRTSLRLVFSSGSEAADWSQCIFAGLAVLLAVFSVLVHFPVNFRALYFTILAAPLAGQLLCGRMMLGWRASSEGMAARMKALDEIPYWYFVLLATLLGVVARYALFPTVGYDENAQHLRLWTQLAYQHIYSFDVLTQVWEVAPFSVALLHAVASLTAGADARGALDLAFLLLLFTQLWAILAHFSVRPLDRMLLLLLLASTPMVGSLLGTLQAELLLALMAAGGVRLALEAKDGWLSSKTLVVISIGAMCAATKLPGALIGALLAMATAVQVWLSRSPAQPVQRPRHWTMLLFLSLMVLLALHSYVTAWKMTGNPFFPLYNGIFKSPFFEAKNFSDARWIKGFSLQSYWTVFFRTSGFLESKDFVAGFQYLFLPFLALAGITRAHRKQLLIVLIPLAGFGIAMFAMTQYWRYVFPALPLATIVIGVLLRERPGSGSGHIAIVRAVIFFYAAANLYFFPGISWVFETAPQQAYREAGRHQITEKINPVKLMTAYVNDKYKGARVLYPASAPFGASLEGDPIYVNWYSPSTEARFGEARNLAGVADFLKVEKVEFVVWSTYDAYVPGSPEWWLREYLSRAGAPELRLGNFVLYRVIGHDLPYRQVFDLQKDASDTTKIVRSEAPEILTTVPIGGASLARYHATLNCQSPAGRLVFQINWDTGPTYYRLIPCSGEPTNFSESLPVPSGASRAEIRVGRQDAPEILLTNLTLETN